MSHRQRCDTSHSCDTTRLIHTHNATWLNGTHSHYWHTIPWKTISCVWYCHNLWCDMTQQDWFTFSTHDTVKNDFVCMVLPQFGDLWPDMTHSDETTRPIHSVQHDSTWRIHMIHICYRKKLSRLHGATKIGHLAMWHASFTRYNMTHSHVMRGIPWKNKFRLHSRQNWAPCDVTWLIHMIQYDVFTWSTWLNNTRIHMT